MFSSVRRKIINIIELFLSLHPPIILIEALNGLSRKGDLTLTLALKFDAKLGCRIRIQTKLHIPKAFSYILVELVSIVVSNSVLPVSRIKILFQ